MPQMDRKMYVAQFEKFQFIKFHFQFAFVCFALHLLLLLSHCSSRGRVRYSKIFYVTKLQTQSESSEPSAKCRDETREQQAGRRRKCLPKSTERIGTSSTVMRQPNTHTTQSLHSPLSTLRKSTQFTLPRFNSHNNIFPYRCVVICLFIVTFFLFLYFKNSLLVHAETGDEQNRLVTRLVEDCVASSLSTTAPQTSATTR